MIVHNDKKKTSSVDSGRECGGSFRGMWHHVGNFPDPALLSIQRYSLASDRMSLELRLCPSLHKCTGSPIQFLDSF